VALDFLSSELNMPANTVRQLMSFWVHKGVVQEKKSTSQQSSGTNSVKKTAAFADYFAVSDQPEATAIYYVPVQVYDGLQSEGTFFIWEGFLLKIWIDLDINEDVENELIKGGQLNGDATQFNTVREMGFIGWLIVG